MDRPRRSALFVPAGNARAIAKARGLPCDVVILDLEDSIASERKEEARAAAVAALSQGFGGRETVVRVNRRDTPWGADDLAALAGVAVDAVLIPKVADAADLAGHITPHPRWAMIESARGLLALPAIAAEAGALVLGPNDLAKDLRARPGADRVPLQPAMALLVAAARAFGAAALDGVCNDLSGGAAFAGECAQGAAFGFDGKTLIHPAQIGPCHAAFAPAPQEVEEALAIVAAYALPENAAAGAIRLNGRMVERLHLDAARLLLARAGLGSPC